MISLVFCVARPTLAGFVCFLVASCYFENAMCNNLDEDEPPPVFPPKSLESPYPRLLHERDVIHYRDVNGQFVTLGSGAFANVTLGELTDSGLHVVIKSFTDSPFREILKEIRMHRYAEDLGVTTRLIGLLPSGPLAGNISLVFEYIAYSKDIFDWLHESKALTTVQWIWTCRQLALALLHFHQHDVLFNDLHQNNILIKKHGNNLQIYFIDFGHATFKSGKNYSGSNFTELNFLAPELSQGSVTTKATDVFSLGYVFHKIAAGINIVPLLFLADWCRAQDPHDRPELLTVIAKLDSVLFGLQLMSWAELSKPSIEYNDWTTTKRDYFILNTENEVGISTPYLFCPFRLRLTLTDKEKTTQWDWLLRYSNIISEKCPVPLFVLDEHDLFAPDFNNTQWISRSTTNDIRISQLRLTNETVVVKEFYGVSFAKIRNEACMTAVFGEMGISPRIIGILIEYKKMTDAAFVQEMWGNGVSVSRFILITSEHEWNLELLQKAAEDITFQNVCSWNSSEYFLGLIKEKAVRICHAKGNRRRTMEKICTLLIQMMSSVHDAGYLINSFRTNNVLIKQKYANNVSFNVDIRLIDLRMTSTVHPGIYLNTSPDDIPRFPYLAPEVHRGERTSRSSDIYSLCFALYETMSEYFVTSTAWVISTKTNHTLNSYLNVYGNSTVQRTNHAHQSKVKSPHATESVLEDRNAAVLKYHNLLLKCLHGQPHERPHLQELLAVSSFAFL